MSQELPVIVKRAWFRDPHGVGNKPESLDAETVMMACEDQSIAAAEWGGGTRISMEDAAWWEYQRGSVIDLDHDLRSGERAVPQIAVDLAKQIQAERSDLDVYIEPEPMKIPEDGEPQWSQNTSWSVVAETTSSMDTARMTFHTEANDTELKRVEMVVGELENRINWRDWDPSRDVKPAEHIEQGSLLGEDFTSQNWEELRQRWVSEVRDFPEAGDPSVMWEMKQCGFDLQASREADEEDLDHEAVSLSLQQGPAVGGPGLER
ncbi:hypothetical protein [Nesterenkonia sp. K-15-9-6]|uniref:hypothetical protein n=1 Tax=Nesterenkonia sp. K-15-9-6 TaxID=3093918 RepID=UPI004043C252